MDVRCQLHLIYYLLGFVPVEMAALCICRAAATFGPTLKEKVYVYMIAVGENMPVTCFVKRYIFIFIVGFFNPPPPSPTPTSL
ncbi:hypothetical protein T11_8658 [Trichinella zimbabwensis]|uniref:Uncharacterized protein n=1 Tax=Trichinella zimbabwensis TaxID=268475 RepID=A0A0V1HIV4_9BILA|nr:hypothetical protein T11_8658 [Trichinella zimbabwensis]